MHSKQKELVRKRRGPGGLVWDISFLLLVLFPLVTGGVWIRRPHLFLEYTDPGPAFLLLSLILFLRWKKGISPEQSRLYSWARKAWSRWREGLGKAPLRTLASLWIPFALLRFFASARRHWAFHSGAADLGIFTNAIWNLSHGQGYFSSLKGGINLLADHQSYIFWAFAPLYRWVSSPILLLALQSLLLTSGGVTLYFLGAKLGAAKKLLPLLPLLFWAYPPTRNANLFDFHPEVLLLPLALLFFWTLESQSAWGRLARIFLLLLCLSTKESAGPVFVGVGLSLVLRRKYIEGASLAFLALAVFLFNAKILPGLFHSQYAYSDVYGHWFRTPFHSFLGLFNLARGKFLWGTLAPLAFLPLLSPFHFVAALPGYAMLFLTGGDQRLSLGFHYAIEPAVGIFWALAAAAATAFAKKKEAKIFWVLVLAMVTFYGRSEIFQIRFFTPSAHEAWLKRDFLPSCNSSTSLSASSALVPHLSNRHWVQALPEIGVPSGQKVDCVVYDEAENNTPMNQAGWTTLLRSLKDYRREFTCGTLQVLRNPQSPTPCLTEVPRCDTEK